jgi:hypothetical protein
MLRRGAVRHCARCGGGGLFDGWFTMKERCPRCGVRFEREEGFFTGVYLVNFGVTLALLFLAVMAYALALGRSDGGDVDLVPIGIAVFVVSVPFPVAFYPFAKTLWFAGHLAMDPLHPDEERDAAAAVGAARPA